jgi:hypothetical protein
VKSSALKITKIGGTLGMIGCIYYMARCFNIAGEWNFQETKRIKSPDQQVEAVVLIGDAGATTATTTFVLLVPSGRHVETNKAPVSDVVFTADHLENFNLIWKQSGLLEIQYDRARIFRFTNLWSIWKGRPSSYAVEIRLAPTSPDFSVPPQDRMPYPTKK